MNFSLVSKESKLLVSQQPWDQLIKVLSKGLGLYDKITRVHVTGFKIGTVLGKSPGSYLLSNDSYSLLRISIQFDLTLRSDFAIYVTCFKFTILHWIYE